MASTAPSFWWCNPKSTIGTRSPTLIFLWWRLVEGLAAALAAALRAGLAELAALLGKGCMVILRAELREKSSSQLKHHIMTVAASKHRTARNAIGCKLATHPPEWKSNAPGDKIVCQICHAHYFSPSSLTLKNVKRLCGPQARWYSSPGSSKILGLKPLLRRTALLFNFNLSQNIC